MNTSDFSRDVFGVCAAIVMLAGCGGLQIPTPAQRPAAGGFAIYHAEPDGQLSGHLYVAGDQAYYASSLERFRIVDGMPESKPDRTYSAVGAPIAVDSASRLYGRAYSQNSYCLDGGDFVLVYPPHSNQPVRTLLVQCNGVSGGSVGVSSLFVDSHGYLYVGAEGSCGECEGDAWYVLIFPPGANGYDKPIENILIGTSNPGWLKGQTTGLAMDVQGDLHVSSSQNTAENVFSFASPTTDPTKIADLTGSGIVSPSGLAFGSSNEMYVDNPNGMSSFISAYRAKASGSRPPDREITVTGQQTFGSGIATGAGLMLIPDPAANVVYAVSVHKNGVQTPLWTLSLPFGFSPQGVKLGL